MSTIKRVIGRATIVAGGLSLVAGTTMAASAAVSTSAAQPNALAASTWLATQTTDGVYLYYGDPDWGATADVAIAHAGAGQGESIGTETLEALRSNVVAATSTPTGISAAGTAKVALVAAIYGEDATDFGGVDLAAQLQSLVVTTGQFRGLYSDDASTTPSWPNTFTQSYAVTAASRLGVGDASSVEYLLAQRCADGGFRLETSAPTCESDVDGTALVIMALEAARNAGVGDAALIDAAISGASGYLVVNQGADGSFSSSGSWGIVNTNTTGVAVQALRASGAFDSADFGTEWLSSQQLLCDVVAEDFGAFPFDAEGYDSAIANAAIPAGGEDSYGRATAQAILGLGAPSLATLTSDDRPLAGDPIACTAAPTTTSTTTTTTAAPSTTAPATSVAPSTTVADETTTTAAPIDESTTTTYPVAVLDSNVTGGGTTSGGYGTNSLAVTGTNGLPFTIAGVGLIALGAAVSASALRLRRS